MLVDGTLSPQLRALEMPVTVLGLKSSEPWLHPLRPAPRLILCLLTHGGGGTSRPSTDTDLYSALAVSRGTVAAWSAYSPNR